MVDWSRTSKAGFPQHDYSKALHLTTYFMGAQRCGDTNP